MLSIRSYDELTAWNDAMALATEVYRHTREYPLAEIAGLTAETRRAASGVPARIAEAWAHRAVVKECRAHLNAARGTLMQLETFLILGMRLGYLTREQMDTIWPFTQTTGEGITVLIRTT